MIAAFYGHPQAIEILLAKGANANASQADGSTALQLSCAHESSEDVEVLRMLVLSGPPAERTEEIYLQTLCPAAEPNTRLLLR